MMGENPVTSGAPRGLTEADCCSVCRREFDKSCLDGLCPHCLWSFIAEERETENSSLPTGAGFLARMPGYRILEEISRGGMGIVYRAQQLQPFREVALKMLLPHQLRSAELLERFRTEILAICSLEHPSVLPVYQTGEYHGVPFFAMKFAGGGTLASLAGWSYGIAAALRPCSGRRLFKRQFPGFPGAPMVKGSPWRRMMGSECVSSRRVTAGLI